LGWVGVDEGRWGADRGRWQGRPHPRSAKQRPAIVEWSVRASAGRAEKGGLQDRCLGQSKSRREAAASAGRPVGQGGAVWRDAGVGAKMPDGFRVQICLTAVGIRARCEQTTRPGSVLDVRIYVLRGKNTPGVLRQALTSWPRLRTEKSPAEETKQPLGGKSTGIKREITTGAAPIPLLSAHGSAEGFSASCLVIPRL
jgi:hypothetical protein